jgi:DNA-binding SARP family transcriptional activator
VSLGSLPGCDSAQPPAAAPPPALGRRCALRLLGGVGGSPGYNTGVRANLRLAKLAGCCGAGGPGSPPGHCLAPARSKRHPLVASQGEFNILGCLEVKGPSERLRLSSNRQRALVAALALQPGAVVPTWRLVEALWGERPPRTAVRSLHSHVARLRLQLDACGLRGVVQTRDPGYLLAAEPSVVDASRFEEHAQLGRTSLASGLAGAAADILVKGLNLWRGDALADAEPTGWTAAQAIRLGELRQVAMEDRCEALLCLGRYGDALVELDRLLVADSVRERLVGLRMIALCGAGRVAEALDAFQRLRGRLGDELGVDPSPEVSVRPARSPCHVPYLSRRHHDQRNCRRAWATSPGVQAN